MATWKKLRVKRNARSIRMRSKDGLIRLRDGRMRSFGVNHLRNLLCIPVLLGLIALAAFMKAPPMARVRFLPNEDETARPLTGWVVNEADYEKLDSRLNASLMYVELTWAELEPQDGIYAFDEVEKARHMDEWWAGGGGLILRVSLDCPGEVGHMDIPEWLYQLTDGDGEFYEATYGAGFAPNYANLTLRDRHRKLIEALAARYDAASGVAYVEIGSLGAHGGWEVERESVSALPLSSIARLYAGHYTLNFDGTPLLMRRAYREAEVEKVGLYNPLLGDIWETWGFLEEIEEGGYDGQIDTDLYSMPNFWTKAPSGGAIATAEELRALITDPAKLERLIDESHITYVVTPPTVDFTDAELEIMNGLSETMGYRLWLRAAEWRSETRRGYRLTTRVTLRNDGAAPPYRVYAAKLGLFKDGQCVTSGVTELDVRELYPGDLIKQLWLDVPYRIEPGEYQLRFKIAGFADGEASLPLQSQGELDDGWLTLGEVMIAE